MTLTGLDSLDACLAKIDRFTRGLKKNEWVIGEGYAPDRFRHRLEPDRYHLDRVTHDHPAFIFSVDEHSAWVNSRALEMAGISAGTDDFPGGEIVRFEDGTPTGILREYRAFEKVFRLLPEVSRPETERRWRLALKLAYSRGVTGVHSFDGPEAFNFLAYMAEENKLGLRINYYPAARMLPQLHRTRTVYGTGTDFFRITGIKLFADGSLGSRTALCFKPYLDNRHNYGIETASTGQIRDAIHSAARLGLPVAVHAIGDKAVANTLDAMEGCPPLPKGARHRIEHLQLVRRKDLLRLKRLSIVASMQPSQCPSDIDLIRKFWGARAANSFLFRSVIARGIDLAFGSDVPIEPLDPIAGIAAAVRRARPGSNDVFYPGERIPAQQAVYHFTVGPAVASGETRCRGMLLPGYPADFVILSDDLIRIPARKIYDTRVLATVLDGQVKYHHASLRL